MTDLRTYWDKLGLDTDSLGKVRPAAELLNERGQPRNSADWIFWDDTVEFRHEVGQFGLRFVKGKKGVTKTWYFQFRMPGDEKKTQRKAVIGDAGAMTFEKARLEYVRLAHGLQNTRRVIDPATGGLVDVADPIDPDARRVVPVIAGSVKEALAKYTADKLAEGAARVNGDAMTEKTRKAKVRRLAAALKPLALLPVDKVTAAALVSVRDAAVKHSPSDARKLRVDLTGFFDWLAESATIPASPMPAGYWGKDGKRKRFLSDSELKALAVALQSEKYPERHAVTLLLLTGMRRGEVLGAEWREIDENARTWTLPASRSKTGVEHVLPLSDLALAVLADLRQHAPGSYLFPGKRSGKPLSELDKPRVARIEAATSAEAFVIHDLRHTLRTNVSALGVLPHIGERMINHAAGKNGYDHHKFTEEMRPGFDAWAAKLSALGFDAVKMLAAPMLALPAPVSSPVTTTSTEETGEGDAPAAGMIAAGFTGDTSAPDLGLC